MIILKAEGTLAAVFHKTIKVMEQNVELSLIHISFCELPEIFVENFAVSDDYETDYTIFSVCGIDIRVLDDCLLYTSRCV